MNNNNNRLENNSLTTFVTILLSHLEYILEDVVEPGYDDAKERYDFIYKSISQIKTQIMNYSFVAPKTFYEKLEILMTDPNYCVISRIWDKDCIHEMVQNKLDKYYMKFTPDMFLELNKIIEDKGCGKLNSKVNDEIEMIMDEIIERTINGDPPKKCPNCDANWCNVSNFDLYQFINNKLEITCKKCERPFKYGGDTRPDYTVCPFCMKNVDDNKWIENETKDEVVYRCPYCNSDSWEKEIIEDSLNNSLTYDEKKHLAKGTTTPEKYPVKVLWGEYPEAMEVMQRV